MTYEKEKIGFKDLTPTLKVIVTLSALYGLIFTVSVLTAIIE